MNKLLWVFASLAILLSVIALALSINVDNKLNKVVIVDAVVLFNEFEMKKEMETSVEKELYKYTQSIDSMKSVREYVAKEKNYELIENIDKGIYDLNARLQQTYEISNNNINEQVWKRLNPLIDDYGKKNNIRVIIGANGMGSVMYAENAINRTQEVLNFVNERYETGI